MQAGTVTRLEKNIDQAASVLFGVACGYSGYLWLGAAGRLGPALVMALAAVVALATYLLSFRFLSLVQPDARKLPVREFRLREVEPLEPDDFEDFETFEPTHFPPLDRANIQALLPSPSGETFEPAELLLTDSYEPGEAGAPQAEPEQAPEPPELELTEMVHAETPAEQEPSPIDAEPEQPQSRVVSLFDAAAMPTPGQLGSRIDRHLQREPAAAQSAEAAQALQDALAELRRAIPSRRV